MMPEKEARFQRAGLAVTQEMASRIRKGMPTKNMPAMIQA